MITFGLLLTYLMSGWPVTFIMCYVPRHYNNSVTRPLGELVGFVYAPHGWVMGRNQWYFEYIGSAAELAIPGFIMPTWVEWQLEKSQTEQQR
jgi:hypothetical protein